MPPSDRCTPCSEITQAMNDNEIAQHLALLSEWQIMHHHGIARLEKHYRFANFAEALSFTNRVGQMAEHYHHHPEIITRWGNVQVRWWTHKIKGLHNNDFLMAAHTDRL